MKKIKTDFLIVGAGLYGCVLAERISTVLKKEVVILERRPHIGGNCYTRVNQENIFNEETIDPSQQFLDCLKKVRNSDPTNATDLKGALATASKTLQNDDLRGKGVIIFSDLHESLNTKRNYPINLENICVYVIYEWSEYQIANPQLIAKDEKAFSDLLIEAGVNPSDIEMKNISSVATNPEMVSNWFRKKF